MKYKKLLSEIETAHYICMSRSFLRQDRMNGYRKNRTPGPPYIRIGRSIRYDQHDLNRWLDERKVTREYTDRNASIDLPYDTQ